MRGIFDRIDCLAHSIGCVAAAATFLVALLPSATVHAQPQSSFWRQLADGPFRVGTKVIFEYDASRPALVGEPAPISKWRPMQIVVWYPAELGSAPVATLRHYIELSAGTFGAGAANAAQRRRLVDEFIERRQSNGIKRQTIEAALNAPMRAVIDAPRAYGRFPLVVFLHSSVWGASVMSEYLASHGFVVAAIESKGARAAAYKLSRENLDAMVDDAAFTIERMRGESNIGKPLGVIGMSNGAIAAVAMELTGKLSDAIVSLDGGIGERTGGIFLGERSGGSPQKFTTPLLHFYTPDNPHLDLTYIRAYQSASRTLIQVGPLRHGDFLTDGALERVLPGALGRAPLEASDGFDAVCRLTLKFLRKQLARDEKAGNDFMATPESNGLLKIERLPAVAEQN